VTTGASDHLSGVKTELFEPILADLDKVWERYATSVRHR